MLVAVLCVPAPVAAQALHPGKTVRVQAPAVLLERLEGVYLGRSGDTVLVGSDERAPVRVPLAAVIRLDVSAGRSRRRDRAQASLA
jgi:hypothetical protein